MFDPKDKTTKNLIEKYKALYELAIKQQDEACLSSDQVKAIRKRVLYECIEIAMNNQNVPQKDRKEIIEQFDRLIQQECPNMLFETPLKFTENGIFKKD